MVGTAHPTYLILKKAVSEKRGINGQDIARMAGCRYFFLGQLVLV
jgi:hypothetical protein